MTVIASFFVAINKLQNHHNLHAMQVQTEYSFIFKPIHHLIIIYYSISTPIKLKKTNL